MAVVPLTRSKHLTPFARLLTAGGEPVYKLLRQAKLPYGCLDDPQMLIPSSAAWDFRELAARSSGMTNIAIDATRHLEFSDGGDFGQALLRAPTLHRLLTKYRALAGAESSAMLIEVNQQNNGDVSFQHHFLLDHGPGQWQSTLYVLCRQIQLVRLAIPDWSPRELWISSSDTKNRRLAIERLGSTAASFGRPFTGFSIPRSLLAMPIAARNLPKRLPPHFDESSVWSGAPGTTYVSTLGQVLLTYANDKWLHIDETAQILGTSIRSIQRRLANEHMTYSGVLEHARSNVGARLLATTDVKMSEISAHLGYSNQSAFTRAFRRWAGVAPREFRRQRQHKHEILDAARKGTDVLALIDPVLDEYRPAGDWGDSLRSTQAV